MAKQTNWYSVLKISGAYLAFLIGSGFATGQEALQFFAAHGWQGYLATFVMMLLLGYTSLSLMRAGRRYELHTNEDVFRHFCGPYLGVALTWYTMIMIVAVAAVMLAGAAATLDQAYGVPFYAGAGLMAILAMATMMLGFRKILDVLGLVGPVLIILTIIVACMSVSQNLAYLADGAARSTELEILTATPHWFFAGFVYVGLTLPAVASLLPQVGATMESEKDIRIVAVIGPMLIGLAMLVVLTALLSSIESVYRAEVPMMVLANEVMPIYGSIFAIVIFLGIFTTVTPLLWTVCSRFAEEETKGYRLLVFGLTLAALLGATVLPFGQLLNLIYPSIGYVGLTILASILVKDVSAFVARNRTIP
jgi:uncharacterized membrane protein YkvI